MKKLILLILAFSLFSCNDGDFEIPAFEFTEDIGSCGEYILFKKNSDATEVLILTVSSSQLGETEGEKSIDIIEDKVIYRIFDAAITDSYFCVSIPPTTPTVLKDIPAESGTIKITTTVISNENEEVTGYQYYITFSNLLFTDDGTRIYHENFEFGTFTVNL